MNDELPLEKTIEVYKALDIECVLIEGYKQIQYPRVLLCRNSDDSDLINKSNELIAIINRDQLMNQPSVPQFIRSEETEWIKFMMEYLTSRVNEERA